MYYCGKREICPYVNVLNERIMKMEGIMELASREITKLNKRIKELECENRNLEEEINQTIRKSFKPNIKKAEGEDEKEKKKKGAPVGHRGGTRLRPTKIDEYIEIYHQKCKNCESKDVKNYEYCKEHVVSDIEIKVKNTCYRMHYGYCSDCKNVLYPEVEGIIKNSHLGPTIRAVSEYLHYIGVPYLKLKKIFKDIFGIEISHPALIGFDKKAAQNGEAIYEQIKQKVRLSDWINCDETGWKKGGENYWLWNFTNKDLAFYRIEKGRSSEVLKDTLTDKYQGILISDFYSAYNVISAKAKQKCLGHLLKEIKNIEEKKGLKADSQDEFLLLQLKSILKEAIKEKTKFIAGEITLDELKGFKEVVAKQLTEFITDKAENKSVRTLQKRIIKHNNELLTFMTIPEIEPTNNRAERQLRPNVIMRKITFGNRSSSGIKSHSIIMSILQTAILNNRKPLDVLIPLVLKPVTDLSLFVSSQNTKAP